MSIENPEDPFKNIYRKEDKRGRPLETRHIKEFESIKEGDEVSFNIVNSETGERTKLRSGIIVLKDSPVLQFVVRESFPDGSLTNHVVNIEEIHDSFSSKKE